ncbi:MAG TPA: MBL fold metallo-hydrolase [Verrucomicrobiae bacterium]|nr:MBL fold metallo-hydrolase [Verrucomicrobiae bacterium]
MKLTFFGATRTVTGSKYLLQANGKNILIECGMYQGHRADWLERNSHLPFDSASIDALLLSHAHIDHSGIIPVLGRSGFRGPIHCTNATADLCSVMLMDSAHIQEQDALFITKKHVKKGLPPAEPLYTQADTEAVLGQFRQVGSYNQATVIADGVTATWLDAGHMLGSAMIVIDIEEGGRKVRLAFSGDLGRGNNDILRNPDHPRDADYLLVESTYGNRVHEPLTDVNDRVCSIINRAVERNGKIIIPAFSVGRTQQLLYTLYELTQNRCIPTLPVYVDSPLSLQATEVFKRHPESFNKKFHDIMLNGHNPFSMSNINFVGSVEESKAINEFKKPCIIISASGMAEAGRVRHHIKNNIEDDRNTILIVGWCAPHTLGAHLATGHKEVNIFGEPYRVRANVETINAFSGHADKNELRNWAEQVTGPLRSIFVIHGEEEAALPFADTLRSIHPQANVLVPEFSTAADL